MKSITAFERTVRRFADRPAIETRGGQSYTYADLDARSDALAAALDARLGDARCAALLVNGPAAIESMIAAQKRGRANAQLSFRGAVGELASMVRTADARGLLFDDANADEALRVVERLDLAAAIHVGEADLDTGQGVESYDAVLDETAGDYPVDVEADAENAIFYTSGTTSEPKGVLQDQERAWLASSQAVMEMSLTPDDVVLVTTPWYHGVTTLAWILATIQVGGTLVPQPTFDPADALSAIEEHGITCVLAVPTQLDAMVDAKIDGGYDVSSLRLVRTGGAVVRPGLVERVREHLTEGVHNTYGMTEAFANLTHAYPDEQIDEPGTVGHRSFVWDDLRVVEPADPPGTPDPEAVVGRGEVGEIIAKGPCSDGYLDRPDEDAKLFVGNWLRTGDVARVDDAGGLHVVDRIDNMLVSGGENVYPQEVEKVLREHPGVEDVAVVGVPHDHWGQQIAAVVVGDVSEADLDEYCREHDELAPFKRPRRYAFADEALPRSDTGTLPRERIRERYFG